MSIQAKHAWSAHVPFKIFNVFPSCCDLSEPGNFTAEWHEPKNAKHRSNGTSEPSERLNGRLHWKHGFAATRSWIFRIGSTHYPRSPDIFKEGTSTFFFFLSTCLSTSFHDFRFPRWYSSKVERPAEVLVMPAETCGKSEDLDIQQNCVVCRGCLPKCYPPDTYTYIYI